MRGHSQIASIGVTAMLGVASLVWSSACDHPAVGNGNATATVTPDAAPVVVQTSAIEASPAQATDANATAAPRPKLKPGARTRVLARAGDRSYDKTFDDLRFEMEVGARFLRSMLTKEIEALNGNKIRIRGFMLPQAQNRGIRQFVLVRDNQECCFGPGAALYDCIYIELPAGQTMEYTRLPVAVEGIFNFHEFNIGGRLMAIYQMSAETVK